MKKEKPKHRFRGLFCTLLAVVLLLGSFAADFCTVKRDGVNPYSSLLLSSETESSISSVKRLDEGGRLYYVNYTADYDGPLLRTVLSAIRLVVGGGCSTFFAQDGEDSFLTARNYDCPHKDKSDNLTGLNVVVNCAPEGKYASVGVADAAWISEIGVPYYEGALDNGKTNLTFLALLPYLCMDGMNEKGLVGSVLAVDITDAETPVKQSEKGRPKTIPPYLLRYILDNCATVEEAVSLAGEYNMQNVTGHTYQIFLTDAKGTACLLSWRYDKMFTVTTDAATNFYQSHTDAADCYYPEGLKEKYPGPAHTKTEYSYGFGHGYTRFNTIAEALDAKKDGSALACLTAEEARDILSRVTQSYVNPVDSQTQYSIIYNSGALTANLWSDMDYQHFYSFSVRP